MKHRGILFCCLFVIALFVVYMQPVVFQDSSFSGPSSTSPTKSPTNLNYEEISAEGLALDINQPLETFEEKYGQPIKTIDSGFGFETRIYSSLDQEQYFEINTDGKIVQAIKVIGDGRVTLEPFSIGMSLSDLTSLTMIYPQFTLENDGQSVSFELMEEDMNYRPLVAFDNGTFAILFFNQQTAQLFAVSYLNQEMLLKLLPYPITDGQGILPSTDADDSEWSAIDTEKENLAFSIMEKLRKATDLDAFGIELSFQQKTKEVLTDLLDHMPDYLTSERLLRYQKTLSQERDSRFSLSQEEWRTVLDANELDAAAAVFEVPVYDVVFSILSWHSDPFIHARFLHQTPEVLGIAIAKENMVVLVKEQENEPTGVSDSGDL